MYQNIVIRMPNWIGDAVMATPVIHDIRSAYPEAKITALCQGRAIASLLFGNPHLDEIFTFTRPNSFLRRQENRDLISRLRQGKYDLGILLPGSFSSAWWLWRGRVAKRVGFTTDFRGWLLTDRLEKPSVEEHLVVTYKRLLDPLDIPLSESEPELFLTEEERAAATLLLRQQQIPEKSRVIGINPGAAYGSAKCWLPDRFRALTEKLLEDPDVHILYFGDEAGAPLTSQICDGLGGRVTNLAGTTSLRELIALIEQLDLFLTGDSGPMHIAAALKTPLVALFGSTSEITTGPYKRGVVIHKHVSCSPCYQRTCPIDFRCMKQISVDEVYAAMQKASRSQQY